MKKLILFLFAFTLPAIAATHSVTLNWTAGTDDTGFIVYRASGTCPATVSSNPVTTGFTAVSTINSATTTNYIDTAVTYGTYCYFVVGTAGGLVSVPSNTVNPSVLPFPATGLTVTVQ